MLNPSVLGKGMSGAKRWSAQSPVRTAKARPEIRELHCASSFNINPTIELPHLPKGSFQELEDVSSYSRGDPLPRRVTPKARIRS